MSRIRLSFPVKLLPAALAAALVMLGSTTAANAQSYDQSPSYDQSAPQDQNVQSDPSNRVARLAYLSGDVEFAPAGETDFGSADINRPLTTGDRLLTGNDGRAALELGDAALRINDDSAFNFLDLNDTTTQVELSQGALNLRVRQLNDGQTYEIDTPTVAFVAGEPGTYRVDVDPNGNGAMVTVFEGGGTVYGENGVSRPVEAGQSYRFEDTTLANVEVQGVPAPDDFDRFSQMRDRRYTNSVSRRYVSQDVVGYDDLDQYGDWQSSPDYGEVWYPNQVAAGWAPYRDGHWAWIDPWGWTWVDSEPWGYAPFHYGRWAYVRNRWGWIPGPREVQSVYAPALVAFVGGSGFSVSIGIGGGGGGDYGEPVGWFPLGPRDVYVPPYRASRNYFTSINVTNIRTTYVNKTVINNYYGNYAAGRPIAGAREYAYRNDARAFTAVPRNVFANARPVRAAVLHVNPGALAKATIAPIPHVAPTRASLAVTPTKRPIAVPVAKAFNRTVVARHAPPPRPVPFAAREKVLAKQGGAPIPVAQLHQMRQQRAQAQAQPERVHVIAKAPKSAAPLPPMKRVAGNPPAAAHAPQTSGAPTGRKPFENTVHPIQAPLNPSNAENPPHAAPMRPGELPSARFAHPQRGANANAQEQRAAQMQQHAAQAQQNAQSHAAQAEQDRQKSEQAHQRSDQARQSEQAHAQQTQQAQQHATQQQARQDEAQARQHDQQMRAQEAQQHADQQRQHADQQQAQQQAAQEHQRADQERAQRDQQQQQAAQEHQRADQERAQQAQQRQQAAQEHQRADQERAQRDQQQQQAAQERQRAQQDQQRAEQQRAQQEQQRAEQANAQQRQQEQQQQREGQMRAQQEQQHQAQMQEQRQAQAHAQQQQQQREQQRPHAPPPPDQRKRHPNDQQDDGGH